MTRTIQKNKWILRRHTSNFNKLCIVAESIRNYTNSSISSEDKAKIQGKLKEQGLYNERNPAMPLDAIDHKIRDISFYMFGYRKKINNKNMFLFSPLGNLFLNNIDNKDKLKKIFFTMLWGMQFEHPESPTSPEFTIYPFRLIFKLLNEEEIDKKIYSFEIAYILMLTNCCLNESDYSNLVKNIKSLRKTNDKKIKELFNKEHHVMVNAIYEWDYYSSKILESAGILIIEKGPIICKLKHGNTKTYRNVSRNYYTLNSELHDLFADLNEEHPFDSHPLKLNDPERIKFDVVKEIYSFFPHSIVKHLEDTQKMKNIEEFLELPKRIKRYSNNTDGTEAYLFEKILNDGFNMFFNVESKIVGGSGNTDLECLFITRPNNRKFAVDAKSTKNKLSGINSGRMDQHRRKIGGEYTIVVTSRYVPAVKYDIKNSNIVLLLANTFSEYLYNCINNEIREIDYTDFDDIIRNNLGKDISSDISELTFKLFATSSI